MPEKNFCSLEEEKAPEAAACCKVEILPAYDHKPEILELVKEYTDSILTMSPDVAGTLSSQHLDQELADMEKKYGLPKGRMYIAFVNNIPVGCCALTGTDNEYCEIKRLYVRPQFRGLHLGTQLAGQIIKDAKAIGYRYMRLDTFPFMESAIRMYEQMGFTFIERYNDNPAESAVFMELALF